ncbi:MAG: hypothetical protein ACRDX9_04295 [Acidimicrobiia bacterium]
MTGTEARPPDHSRQRRWIALLLVVVSSIAVLASVIALWAHQTIFDTDSFMETIEPVLDDPQLEAALGDFVTEEVTGALDLEERLQEPLANLDAFLSAALLGLIDNDRITDRLAGLDRPTLTALAAPIAERFNERIARIVGDLMASPQVDELVPQVIRRAHESAVALLRGNMEELPNLSVTEGEVRLNLLPLVATALQRIGQELRDLLPDLDLPTVISSNVDEAIAQFRASLGDRVPDDFGQVTVMSEDRLNEIQATTERADRWVWGLVVLTVLLIAAAIVISPTRRRTAIELALGVVIAFVLGIALLRRLETVVVGEIANPQTSATAADIMGEVLTGLRNGIGVVLVVASVVAIALYLAGRPQWVSDVLPGEAGAEGVGIDRWVSAHYDILRLCVIALAVLTLFLTGLSVVSIVVVIALLALILWWMARARGRGATTVSPAAGGTTGEAGEGETTS